MRRATASLVLAAFLTACSVAPAGGGGSGEGGAGGGGSGGVDGPGGAGGGGAGGAGGGGAGGAGGTGGSGGPGGAGGSGGTGEECSGSDPDSFAITALEPDTGRVGDAVVIRGANFHPRAECHDVQFNGAPTTAVEVIDGSTLRAVVPQFASTGPVTVRRSGWVTAVGPVFTVLHAPDPVISRVTPDRIPAGSPDTEVRIDGANFVPEAVGVLLDYLPLQVLEATATTIRFVVPADLLVTPRIGRLGVVNHDPAGDRHDSATLAVAQDLRVVRALAMGPREFLLLFDSEPPAPGLLPSHVVLDPPLGAVTTGACAWSWGSTCFRIETAAEQVRGMLYTVRVTGLPGNFGGEVTRPTASFVGYGGAPVWLGSFRAPGCGAAGLRRPVGFGRFGDGVVVVEREGRQLQVFDASGPGPFFGTVGGAAGWYAGAETADGCDGAPVPAGSTPLRAPRGLVGFGGGPGPRLYATDTGDGELLSLRRGSGDDDWTDVTAFSRLETSRPLAAPVLLGVIPGADDRVILADPSDQLALVYRSGLRLASTPGAGSGPGQLSLGVGDGASPGAVRITPQNRLYVTDTGNHRIQVFDDGLAFVHWLGAGTIGFSTAPCCTESAADGGFTRPRSIAYDDGNTLFVGDEAGGGRIQRFDLQGHWLSSVALAFVPAAMIVDHTGVLWVADELGDEVHRLQP